MSASATAWIHRQAPADDGSADEAQGRPGSEPAMGGVERLQVSNEDRRDEPEGKGRDHQEHRWERQAKVSAPHGLGRGGALDASVADEKAQAQGEPAQHQPARRHGGVKERDPRSARWGRHGARCLPEAEGL